MSSMSLQLMNPPRMVIVGGTLDENKEVLNHDEEMDFDDLLNKDLPKRVLAFTSKTFLQQLVLHSTVVLFVERKFAQSTVV